MFEVERARAGGIGVVGDGAQRRAAARTARSRALAPAELAWIALVPGALLTLAAILALGPPLAHLLAHRSSDALWPPGWWESKGRPEPVKHARYLIAVAAPPLYGAFVLLAARRPPRLRPPAIRVLVLAGQIALLAFVVVEALGQQNVIPPGRELAPVFEAKLLAEAAAIGALLAIVPRWSRLTDAVVRLARERTSTRAVCAALAVLFTATWLIEVIDTDRLVEDAGVMNWTLNDVFAIFDGRTPLVDYHPIYAKLLPYPSALVMAAFGETTFVFTAFLCVLCVLALLGVYALLRRVTRSSPLALALFVPFVALSDVGHPMILPAMWPMRYGGAYLLAWLTARHLDGARPQRLWPLFLAAAIVAVNDLDFGVAATVASAAAVLCARPPRSLRAAGWMAADAAAGLLGGLAIVGLFTLVRSGSLPSLGVLLEWPRIFVDLGWFALPMPSLGLHVVFYATFGAAIALAAVRIAARASDRLLTSMLAWAGVFGLLAGAYYAGRSDEIKLESIFSTWAFALALLTVACVRALAARRWRAPTIPELLVLYALGLAICTLKDIPRPGPTIARLTTHEPPPVYRPTAERFIRPHVRRGEKVAILLPLSFRLAYELGLVNVAPYEFMNAIVTREQMQTLLDTVEREHVREIFMPSPGYRILEEAEADPAQVQLLEQAGFRQGAQHNGMLELQRTTG